MKTYSEFIENELNEITISSAIAERKLNSIAKKIYGETDLDEKLNLLAKEMHVAFIGIVFEIHKLSKKR